MVLDAVVAALAFAASAGALAQHDGAADIREPDAAAYALLAVFSASAVVRRRAPRVALATVLVSGLVYAGANYPEALTVVGLLPVYTAGSVLAARASKLALGGALVAATIGSTLGPGPTDPGIPAVVLAAWLLGNVTRTRRDHTAELERKNRQLEEAQRELAEQAVTEERLRIARELHDVVAHTMTVVALHAGTGRMVADDDPAAARNALATIETATRSALVEMRRLLGVLRGAPDGHGEAVPNGLAPAPGLGDLDALVAEVGRSGATIDVRVEGDRADVPPGVDLSAYRIVQEALTNVIKHAGPARVTVTVRYEPAAVTVEVDDDGARPPGSPPGAPTAVLPGSGHGLVGMRERVAMHDGELHAGPRPAGGFRVMARLPFTDGEGP